MNFRRLKKLSFKSQAPVLVGIILVFGLFAVITGTQQRQDPRSRAAGTGGTGNCLTVNASTGEDLVADNCTIASGFNGSIIGNFNTIQGGLGGPVGNIIGNNNVIYGGVNGCIKGNNNEVWGGINGAVVGTGNIIHGGQGTGTCPPTPTVPPTQSPTATPTTKPNGTCADGIDNNQNELIDGGDPVCHTDGNQNNPDSYDPTRNEVQITPTTSSGSSLICTTTPIVLSDLMRPVSVTLKNSSGAVIPGKTITWSGGNYISINPTSSITNSSGVATVNAGVVQSSAPSFTGAIVSSFAGDSSAGTATCSTPVTYTAISITTTPTVTVGPTVTVPPSNTSIKLNLFLHGLGKGGDAANPNSGGNANPLRPQRGVKVEVFNDQNQLLVTKEGTVNFNSSAGNFIGTIDLGATLTTGVYTVKVKTNQFLKTLVPGIQNLVQGQANQLPKTVMVNGDIDGNNQINILDYNILLGCYSDFLPPVSCTAENKPLSDLDDDGEVAQFDYNLFLRELTNREGV